MQILWLFFFISPFIISCSSKLERHIYTFTIPSNIRNDNWEEKKVTIRVIEFSSNPPYDADSIFYKVSDVHIQSWRYHQWATSPSLLLTNYFKEYLEATGKFTVVESDEEATLELQGNLIEIGEVDKANIWYGALKLKLKVIDLKQRKIIWSGKIEGMEVAEEKNVESIVKAIDKILRNSMPKIVELIYSTGVSLE